MDFNDFPKNFTEVFQKANLIQQEMAKVQASLEEKEVEASAGGGMVLVRINGAQQLVSIKIEPTVVNPEDIPMLEDLVKAAVNEGMRKSKEIFKEELKKLTGGLPIPGFS